MVKALHVFWLVDGQAAMEQKAGGELAVMVPDLVSLLVLVKSTLKACSLPHEDHTMLVKNMLLLPVGPGTDMLNLLQVRHGFAIHQLCLAPHSATCNTSPRQAGYTVTVHTHSLVVLC